jgi:cysteinyl-tRNA synthetase
MSMKYLGERFDIHTGGQDLKFPHHEDEIAQSEGATGRPVVNTWVHGGFLRLGGSKMAKSAGNIIRITDLADMGLDPLSYRYLTFQTRYRNQMDFSDEAMRAADGRVKELRTKMAEWSKEERPDGLSPEAKDLDARFREAVADDLDLPRALTVMSELERARVPGSEKYALLASWDTVLGLDLERLAGFQIPTDVQALIDQRDEARRQKDYARSDEIRDRLTALGWEVMDTSEGTKVRPLR